MAQHEVILIVVFHLSCWGIQSIQA